MKIKFLGAARTVTGSCYVIEAAGKRFAVDCGMHQGNKEIAKRNFNTDIYKPDRIDFFLLTHAHIDHSGLLPRMTKSGFKGKVYATEPTRDLLEIMLLDSAHIQEMEAAWENKKRGRRGSRDVEPLYTQSDALDVMKLFETVEYNEAFEPAPGITVHYKDAGHILGSAIIEIWVEENGNNRQKMVFSGDLGRPRQFLVNDPTPVGAADFLFLESTYGSRNHKNEEDSLDELSEAIKYSYNNKEKVIIPAFAVERSQEIIYTLFLLRKSGRLPEDMPVYLDSPLAIRATEIFRRHYDFFDKDLKKLVKNGENPLSLPNLRFTLSTQESQAINNTQGSAIVISASGMADAGRIKHHLRHNLWREGASVVFVGFQAEGSPGRKLVDGAKTLRILGDEVAVKARIFTIGGFSGHAGQSQIIKWLDYFRTPNMRVFIIHGEYQSQKVLAEMVRDKYKLDVYIPDYLEEIVLKPGEEPKKTRDPEKARPSIDWNYLIADTEGKMSEIRSRMDKIRTAGWVEQTELRDRLMEANRALMELISQV